MLIKEAKTQKTHQNLLKSSLFLAPEINVNFVRPSASCDTTLVSVLSLAGNRSSKTLPRLALSAITIGYHAFQLHKLNNMRILLLAICFMHQGRPIFGQGTVTHGNVNNLTNDLCLNMK